MSYLNTQNPRSESAQLAEVSCVAALFLNEAADVVPYFIGYDVSSFANEYTRALVTGYIECFKKNGYCDAALVAEMIENSEKPPQYWLEETIKSSSAITLGMAHQIPHHLRIISEAAAKEKILKLIENKDFDDSSLQDIISDLSSSVQLAKEAAQSNVDEAKCMSELLALAEEEDEGPPPPMTRFSYLNKLLNKRTPRPGHFWVIGGYQKVGKTTFTAQICADFMSQGMTIRFISLEMSNTELARKMKRIIDLGGGMDNQHIDNFFVSELKAPSINDIIQEISTCKQDIVVVDYLQIISFNGDERQAMEKLPMELKNAARLSGKIVIALSQVGNDAATNITRKKTPFKASANIGAAADIGIALYRDLDAEETSSSVIHEAKADLVVSRHGPQGVVQVFFDSGKGLYLDKEIAPTHPHEEMGGESIPF